MKNLLPRHHRAHDAGLESFDGWPKTAAIAGQVAPDRWTKKSQNTTIPTFENHAQQPEDVAARNTRHGMPALAFQALELALVAPVFRFQVPDGRFNGSPAFKQLLLRIR